MVQERKKGPISQIMQLDFPVFNIQGKEVERITLNHQVFDGKVNLVLIQQAVVTQLANQRKGIALTKTRGNVRGGGRKPWRQKGTGRARVGSSRSPIWRGGGVTFGPQLRSYNKDFPKKMKIQALKSALNAKLKDQQILIIDDLSIDVPKTKFFFEIINNLNINNFKMRFVVEAFANNLKLATRNIKKVFLAKVSDVSTKEIIDCDRVILTKKTLRKIEERISKSCVNKKKNEALND